MKILRSLVLALAIVAVPAVTVPDATPQAQAEFTVWRGWLIEWEWTPMPGQPNGGQWTIVSVEPYNWY